MIGDAVAAETVPRATLVRAGAPFCVLYVIQAVHEYLCTRFPVQTQAALTANEAPGYSGRGPNETAK
jgi:hypothetical protein